VPSIAMMMFLEPFKAAAAEGAVVELKLRLLAGSIPALQAHALKQRLEDVENPVIDRFAGSLSAQDAETLRLCRQLRNKVLHADFRAARGRLNELGIETTSSEVKKVDIPVVSVAAISEKIRGVQAGTEGMFVADTLSTASGTNYGWFLEAGTSGDFQKAAEVFKRASTIIDRLANI
jgi:hypothetical protein